MKRWFTIYSVGAWHRYTKTNQVDLSFLTLNVYATTNADERIFHLQKYSWEFKT